MPAGLADVFAGSLPAPKLTAVLAPDREVDLLSVMVTTAKGWTRLVTAYGRDGRGHGQDALLGESTQTDLPAPLPPINQGTGGDGHVPILVGSKVYAFFHHSYPTSISCVDRATGALCPGYPQVVRTVGADGCARRG